MKAFFGRSSSRPSPLVTGLGNSVASSLEGYAHATPERRLAVHVTASGLIITPKTPFAAHHHASSSQAQENNSSNAGKDRKIAQPAAPIRISWGRQAKIEQLHIKDAKSLTDAVADDAEIQIYGIVGLMRVFNNAYLLVITSRSLAGTLFSQSYPIYRCSGVLAIPLTEALAKPIIKAEHTRQASASAAGDGEEMTSSDESGEEGEDDVDRDEVLTPSLLPRDSFFGEQFAASADTSLASIEQVQAAATLRPPKGRSWVPLDRRERAVSEGDTPLEVESLPEQEDNAEQATASGDKSGPTQELGATDSVEVPQGAEVAEKTGQEDGSKVLTPDERWHEATKAELEDKLVREAAKLFARGEMWFAYDLDITTSLQKKRTLVEQSSGSQQGASSLPFQEPSQTVPLWKRVDRQFWYNESLQKDFIENGLHAYILPIVQGYFQVTSLPLPGTDSTSVEGPDGDAMDAATEAAGADDAEAQLLVISRRSKERAGLRYQRRGINDQGHVANYAETEQILFVRKGAATHLLSFVQFRGSIPLFWSQSPFSMKPPPVLERNDADNVKACSRHFEAQVQRYGKVTCINLAEQHGKEGQITEAYRKRVEEDIKKGDAVKYVAFDFHKECSGMRFENVSKLLDNVHDTIEGMSYFWASKEHGNAPTVIKSTQSGAFRVSCLDCLDRTNVVQSAFGRNVLNAQLANIGVLSASAPKDEDFEFVFNDSWANNGDMISQAYAGTRALKGDFTRTGKRNFFGMMNDATASVYRMVQGAVTDFFRQTVIDYVQGSLGLSGLERYNDQLAAQDPSESFRLAKVRASAIETCVSLVIGADETHLGGWTLFSPMESNKIHSSKFEEKVVLLTNKAIYSCGYDFTSEKLSEFSKILLGDIAGIKKGLYIISPNEAYHPEDNWGMIITYLTEEKRLNNASMRNVPPPSAATTSNFIAFRAVRSETNDYPITATAATNGTITKEQSRWWQRSQSRDRQKTSVGDEDILVLSPRQTIDRLVAMLVEQCLDVGAVENEKDFVQDETIQSLTQAKANASLFAPLLEGLKRRLWL